MGDPTEAGLTVRQLVAAIALDQYRVALAADGHDDDTIESLLPGDPLGIARRTDGTWRPNAAAWPSCVRMIRGARGGRFLARPAGRTPPPRHFRDSPWWLRSGRVLGWTHRYRESWLGSQNEWSFRRGQRTGSSGALSGPSLGSSPCATTSGSSPGRRMMTATRSWPWQQARRFADVAHGRLRRTRQTAITCTRRQLRLPPRSCCCTFPYPVRCFGQDLPRRTLVNLKVRPREMFEGLVRGQTYVEFASLR